ncbi:hypothetical protein PV11_03484 [Exophiala sideris]|uniref:Heterokaryon incompatibility domain-containing protein n=1 Tax=Exophiala sideris TaxID=1016849 RepID=A0A0D1Z315_9EURO|nr:hypothetical protein PV11_03484 [Exophiala sideris]
MRLLERKPDSDLVFREVTHNDAAAYAILSHTWLAHNTVEVSFQDTEAGIGKNKAGWRKIQFCADKAAADGLRFWIDPCCVDTRNNTELFRANLMFHWYQKAARCYVFLTDVSAHDGKETSQQHVLHGEAAFRKSRWFTRGERLGSQPTLELIIHETTGIPKAALRGEPLDSLSRDERMSWASQRHTKEEEDQAYSLLGIFGVSMLLNYGKGKEKALK